MDRSETLRSISTRSKPWDVVIIGGGATGIGCALDAASRGFDVLLLEQHDLGKGTSSRSTKLIHGGFRYLRQRDISLVRESLIERGRLLQNAPQAIKVQPFVIPCYSSFERAFYAAGLKVYDLLAAGYGIGRSRILSRSDTIERLPTIEKKGLSGGVLYYDGQFDDSRFLIDMFQAARSYGASVLNYARVERLETSDREGVKLLDVEDMSSGSRMQLSAKVVINAAGIFSDEVRGMSDADAGRSLTFSQGVHVVLDRHFLPGGQAVMIPKTSDGRVLFCIPWHDRVLVGTTDTPTDTAILEPRAKEAEIDFLLETCGKYLADKPTRRDILSVFAGIRPLARSGRTSRTSSLSRGHVLFVDRSGLVTITGGKWTTYRRMAEDAVDTAISVGGLEKAQCRTQTLAIPSIANDAGGNILHRSLPYTEEDVLRAVRDELAVSVEDVLARRTRALFLDASAAIEMAPQTAVLMARELGKNDDWIKGEIAAFTELAKGYSVDTTDSP